MTDSNDDAKTGPRPYRVPPAEFRFKKGTSGNLKGRPPKERALVTTKFGGQPGIGFESRIKAIAIEEAYRLITVISRGFFDSLNDRFALCCSKNVVKPLT